jgi:hypothetical protein
MSFKEHKINLYKELLENANNLDFKSSETL